MKTEDVTCSCSGMMVDSPVKSPPDITMARITSPQPQTSPEKKQATIPAISNSPTLPGNDVTMSPVSGSESASDVSMVTEPVSQKPASLGTPLETPYPRHISEGEMQVLQDCLHRWRTEVENDVRGILDIIFMPLHR